MTAQDDFERELAARFATEREQEGRNAPPLGRVLAARSPLRRSRWGVPALALGGALLLTVFLRGNGGEPVAGVGRDPAPFALVPGELRVPTDFLLEATHLVHANQLPAIGQVDWYPLVPGQSDAPDPTTNSTRRN